MTCGPISVPFHCSKWYAKWYPCYTTSGIVLGCFIIVWMVSSGSQLLFKYHSPIRLVRVTVQSTTILRFTVSKTAYYVMQECYFIWPDRKYHNHTSVFI